jgi:hypothetical protein
MKCIVWISENDLALFSYNDHLGDRAAPILGNSSFTIDFSINKKTRQIIKAY